jgi:hypothetical protein
VYFTFFSVAVALAQYPHCLFVIFSSFCFSNFFFFFCALLYNNFLPEFFFPVLFYHSSNHDFLCFSIISTIFFLLFALSLLFTKQFFFVIFLVFLLELFFPQLSYIFLSGGRKNNKTKIDVEMEKLMPSWVRKLSRREKSYKRKLGFLLRRLMEIN